MREENRAGTPESSKVAVVRCNTYEPPQVRDAVRHGISLLGGIESFVRRGEKLVLKPNLLVASAPEKAVTTHPSVFRAVTEILLEAGVEVQYGDSPGFGGPEHAANKSGILKAAQELGASLADFVNGSTVSFPEGHLIRQFTLAQGVLDAGGVISLPKWKTHALLRVTGAVKNQFGCIPGVLKGEFHARMADIHRFAQMLVDLTRCIRPRLYVMDAIVAMEGNGPRSGSCRPMNVLLFSADPVALDAIACRMINLDPELVLTNTFGQELGLGRISGIEVIGDPLESFIVEDFEVERKPGVQKPAMRGWMARWTRSLAVPRPVIDESLCTKCGTCVKVCPATPKAVDFRTGGKDLPPSYDYDACIRCYCCQELCPERAISVYVPPVGRLIHRG